VCLACSATSRRLLSKLNTTVLLLAGLLVKVKSQSVALIYSCNKLMHSYAYTVYEVYAVQFLLLDSCATAKCDGNGMLDCKLALCLLYLSFYNVCLLTL
jgi:hypothetical protein